MRKFEYVNRVLSTGYSMKEPEFDLPKRATKNSIAYDFYSPEDFVVEPHSKYMLWTGIKAQFQDDEALILNVRSSMGKKNIMLSNTQAWVESDYYNNRDNEGHMWVCLQNHGDKEYIINKGDAYAQGIFVKFLTTDDDNVKTLRTGGIGSTNKKKEGRENE